MQSSRAPRFTPPVETLRPRLVWVTAFRTGVATLLLGIYALRLFSGHASGASPGDVISLWLTASIYAVVLVQAAFLRGSRPGVPSALAHVVGDVAIATVLVFLTGGAESPFTFTYILAVVGAAILLGDREALGAAFACSASFVALSGAVAAGAITPPTGPTVVSPARLLFICASNVLAQFLVAALAGLLARQLTTTGGRLSAREQDLRELSRLQQLILENMPSGLLTCDSEGLISYVNRSAQQILGIGKEALSHELERVLPGVIGLKSRARSEVTVTTAGGVRKILGLSVSPLTNDSSSLLVVFQDLTDLRRAEAELRRVDRMAELGALSAQLAHEIRNPLAAMRGSAQLLAEDAGEGTQRLVRILTGEADRLDQLVRDFLAFSRPPVPVRQRCDLDQLLQQTLELLAADPLAGGVTIDFERGGLTAEVDPDQIRQVLLNLFRNALAAAGPGGRVRAFFSRPKGQVRIHVWDSGGSIATADLPHIFEPFFSKRPGGTGLGLSTVHSIVLAHGGEVRVRSSPAQGTEFVVGFEAHEPRAG